MHPPRFLHPPPLRCSAEKERLPAACRNQVRCSAFVRLSRWESLSCSLALKAKSGYSGARREFLGSGADIVSCSHPDYTILFLHAASHCHELATPPRTYPRCARRGAFSPLLLWQKEHEMDLWCLFCFSRILLLPNLPAFEKAESQIILKRDVCLYKNKANGRHQHVQVALFGFLRLHTRKMPVWWAHEDYLFGPRIVLWVHDSSPAHIFIQHWNPEQAKFLFWSIF
jgi:hypothetical protein